jgi:multidrug resistance efflux pump
VEETPDISTRTAVGSSRVPAEPRRKRTGILGGGLRLLVAVLILGGAGYYAVSMIGSRPEPVQRQARERSFTVAVIEPEMGTYAPVVQSFGQVVAGRSIDLRAQVSGEVIEIASALVAGGTVTAGEILLRIDDFDYQLAEDEAEAALIEARLAKAEAEQQVELQTIAHDLAARQLESAERDLERARSLLDGGTITNQEVETRGIAVAEREQAVQQAEVALLVGRTNVVRQSATIEHADRQLEQARRLLANTVISAPFNGVVVTEHAEVGRVFSPNESVATLYDADALEVTFTLSDQQYGMLTSVGLIGREATVIWDIQPEPITLTGAISRAGAEVNSALGGVEVFASLSGEARTPLRPGTFVEVLVDGLDYPDTLRIPETALYENSHFYTVRDGRMARVDAQLLARDDDSLIVRAEVPEGERIIVTRLAQAGIGVLVAIEGEEPAQVFGGGGPQVGAPGQRPDGAPGGGQRPNGAGGPVAGGPGAGGPPAAEGGN